MFTRTADHAVMTEQQITIKLKRATADALKAEARRRGVGYHDFAAEILAKVAADRIYAAVIDP
jgi:predicted DNA binding CopG/RHH family protein